MNNQNENIIYCRRLSKHFGKVIALEDIELQVKQGRILALLGLNGAGKTTLIKCLLQLITPTYGEIFFKAKPISHENIQQYFAYLPEAFKLYNELSALEFLSILFKGIGKKQQTPESVLTWAGLENARKRKIKTYSRGMLQRLGLAVCLINDPQIIVLDEPFLGLDLLGQTQILDLLKQLKTQGRTVVFSSHILSQVQRIADDIGIIHQGKLRWTGALQDFLVQHQASSLEEAFLKNIR